MRSVLTCFLVGAACVAACSGPDNPGEAEEPAAGTAVAKTAPAAVAATPETIAPSMQDGPGPPPVAWRFGTDAADTEPTPNWSVGADGFRGRAGPGPALTTQWNYEALVCDFEWRVLDDAARAWVWIARERGAPLLRIALGGPQTGASTEVLESRPLPTLPRVGEWTHWRVSVSPGILSLVSQGVGVWSRRSPNLGRVYVGFEVDTGELELREVQVLETGFADLGAPEHWSQPGNTWHFEDGLWSYDGGGGDLVTREEFQHYVLRAEWRIRPGGNTGILLRGTYPWQVEAWDDPAGSGFFGAAAQADLVLAPPRPLDVPTGKWNHVEASLVEDHLSVWMNGDWMFTGLDLGAEPGFPERGPLGLQDHGEPVEYRNLRIARLAGDALERWKLLQGARAGARADTTRAGPNADALAPAESLALLHPAAGLEVALVAAEPEVVRPVALCPDPQGNLYVGEAFTYRETHVFLPDADPPTDGRNRIRYLLLEDGRCVASRVAAAGFPDPVMGLALADGRLFATQAEELLSFAIAPDGTLNDRRRLVHAATDRENPYGFFHVRVGPDGKLWFSVGGSSSEEGLTLVGADGTTVRPRGRSGGVFRCRRDGSRLELLVEGVRVPFGFDVLADGSIWLAESGQLGPDRLIHAVQGAVQGSDYGFETPRGLGGTDWIGPAYPLRGSFTALLSYADDAFPAEYRGQLFVANWGSHGFNPRNRAIERFAARSTTPERRAPLLVSEDTHFRPTDMASGPDGQLFVADWYGRDDESDARGRIWALWPKRPPSALTSKAPELAEASSAQLIEHLDHARQATRAEARTRLVAAGEATLAELSATLARGDAARMPACLWILAELDTPAARRAMLPALGVGPAPHRALAWRLLIAAARQDEALGTQLAGLALESRDTRSPELRLSLSAALPAGSERDAVLIGVCNELGTDPEADERLLIAAAEALARDGGDDALASVWNAQAPPGRLARVALAVALLERTPNAPRAHELLIASLERSDGKELSALLALAQLASDARLGPALEQALGGANVSVRELARGTQVLGRLGLSAAARARLSAHLVRRLNEEVFIGSFDDRIDALRLIEELAPDELPLRFLLDCLLEKRDRRLQVETHRVLLELGASAPELLARLRAMATSVQEGPLQRMQAIATLGRLDPDPRPDFWVPLALDGSDLIAFAALRALREQFGNVALGTALAEAYAGGRPRPAGYLEELGLCLQRLGVPAEAWPEGLAAPTQSSTEQLNELGARVLDRLRVVPPAKQPRASAPRGQLAFWSTISSCSTCHSIDGRGGARGPALDGIGALAQPEYIIESILEPSKHIKAGYESVIVEHRDGSTKSGWAREVEDELWISDAGPEPTRWKLADVTRRDPDPLSSMPSGLEAGMTVAELSDLVGFLLTLQEGP